jgi:uncharacterized hydrophobic protein (TIGR00271 family)
VLHLRIHVPSDLRGAVIEVLDADPGVINLSVVGGAALIEGLTERDDQLRVGDVVEADVLFVSLASVLEALEALGVAERGSISATEVAVAMSSAADRSARRLSRTGEELISWEQVAARTSDDVSLSLASALLMSVAGLIAAIGILTNNEILLVGAMIVSPDFGPLAGFCVAVVGGHRSEARSSALALVLGFSIAALVAFVATAITRIVAIVPAAYLEGTRPISELVSSPGLASFLVAVAAGIAGMIALGQTKSGAIVGVLVSVTTIPAAANVGVSLAMGLPSEALAALAQLGVNLLGMAVAGVATLKAARVLSRRRLKDAAEIEAVHRPGVVATLFEGGPPDATSSGDVAAEPPASGFHPGRIVRDLFSSRRK